MRRIRPIRLISRIFKFFTATRRRKILSALLSLLVLLTSIRFTFFKPKTIEAAWWDDNWQYRIKTTITNPGSGLTDFQVAITLDTASLISAGKMRDDCADIRVFNSTHSQLQNYWVEGCNTTITKIWMKQSFSANEVKVFYTYYGNLSAFINTETNPSNIFEFFDGFDDTSINTSVWTANASDYNLAEGAVRLNTGALRTTNPLPFNLNDGYVLETRMNTHSIASPYGGTLTAIDAASYTQSNNAGANATVLLMRNKNSTSVYRWVANGSSASYNISSGVSTFTTSDSTWYVFSEFFHSGGLKISQNYGTTTDLSFTWVKNPKYITLGYYSGNYDLQDTSYDWVRVRKYASPEPSSNNFSEEKAPGPIAYWKFDEGYTAAIEQPITKNEQQINIVTQDYSTTSTSFVPTDNSLGLIHWDASKYPGSTVYFDIVAYDSPGINSDCYITLNKEDGTEITSLSTSTDGWIRKRSGSLSLTNNTNYTVRLRSNTGTTCTLRSARLIIIQTATTKITNTETQVEIGNTEIQDANSYTPLLDKKIWNFDSSKFTPTPTVYFEASLRGSQPTIEQQINIVTQDYSTTSTSFVPTDNSLGLIHWDASKYPGSTVYFDIVAYDSPGINSDCYITLNKEDGTEITSLSTSTDGWIRKRSGSLSLTNNTNYTVRLRSNTGTTCTLRSARLIIIQTDTTKIAGTQTQIEVGNNETTTSTTDIQLTNKKIYYYDSSKFTPAPTIYFEATLSNDTAGQTAYASLYPNGSSCTGQITGSEISVTGTSWTRVRSAAINLTSGNEYMVCIRASGGTARIANAKIILDQSDANGITALEIVHQQVNTSKTNTGSTYTSQDYQNRFNPDIDSNQVSFSGGVFTYYYEATLKTSAGTGYAQLYNSTNNSAITGSEVSTTSTSYTRQRSANITSNMPSYPSYDYAQNLDTQIKNSSTNTTTVSNTWIIVQVSNLATSSVTAFASLYTNGVNCSSQVSGSEVSVSTNSWARVRSGSISLSTGADYMVCVRSSISNIPIRIANAKIILDQSDANGIKAVETIRQMVNTPATDTDSTYTDQKYLNSYNPNNDNFETENYNNSAIYFEATMKTSAGTGYVILKNNTDGNTITGSELTTTSTAYQRVRSSSIAGNMPLTAKELDTQIKNSSTNTTSVSNSWLIIQNNNTIPSGTHDSSLNAKHGNLNGPSWSSDCISGNCLNFDGTNDYVKVPDNPTLDFAGSDSFTISGWFKHKVLSVGTIIAKYNFSTGTDGGYKVYMESNGNITFGIDDDATSFPEDSASSTSVNYSDNFWHYFAAVKDGTNSITLYIDGARVAQDSSLSATGTLANSDPLYIGIDGDGASKPWGGQIDELKIYPYARTESEIKQDFLKASSSHGSSASFGTKDTSHLYNGLVGYWQMDEKSANTCNSTDDNCDSSGVGNHAAWNGNAGYSSGKFAGSISLDGTGDFSLLSYTNRIPSYSGEKYQPIIITNNTSSDLTNYQVRLEVNYDSDMQPDFDDIRFKNSSGNFLDYWLESKTDGVSAVVWVEVDSIPSNGSATIYMHYGDNSASSSSSITNTFINNSIFHETGSSSDNIDNHSEADLIRQNNVPSSTNYTTSINDTSGGDNFFRRYRFLFVADTNGTHNFATNSDDGSELALFPGDGYGDGFNTTHPFGDHTVLASWYGIHPGSTCGTQGSIGSLNLTNGQGYWLDYLMTEQGGSQLAQVCIQEPGGSYQIVSTTNFPNQLFARKYTSGPEPTTLILPEQHAQISIAAWINADVLDSTQRNIIARDSSPSFDWFIGASATSSGKLVYSADGETNIGTSTATLSTGKWYHVAMVSDGTKTKLFINGNLDSETENSGTLPGEGNIAIGAAANGTQSWDGRIDEVRIYNRALSDSEVQALYNWAPGPVGYWKFDEGTGATAYDMSGNSNNATLTGGERTIGRYGKSYKTSINLSQEKAQITDPASGILDFDNTQDFTYELFFKGTNVDSDTGVAYLYFKGASSNISAGYMMRVHSTNDVRCRYTDGNGTGNDEVVANIPTIFNNQWHHISCVMDRDGSEVGTAGFHMYVDGVLSASDTNLTEGSGTNNLNVVIGEVDLQTELEGQIDEVQVYSYARTSAQIVEDMNAGHLAPGSPIGSALGYWKFDEGYGDTANDSGTGNNNANLAGTNTCPGNTSCPSWTNDGKIGKALNFDGGDYLTIADAPFDITGDFTLSAWVNRSTGGTVSRHIITKRTTAVNSGGYGLAVGNSGEVYCQTSNGTSLTNSYTPTGLVTSTSGWVHLTAVKSGTTCRVYVNAVDRTTTFGVHSSVANNNNNLTIGAAADLAEFWYGKIDEVKVFNTALTAEQVKLLYNQSKSAVFGSTSTDSSGNPSWSSANEYCPPGQGSSCTPPVAEWKFDEKSGTTANDTSGNGFNGTLINSPSWSHQGLCKNGSCLQLNGTNQYVDIGTGPSSVRSVEFWVYPKTSTEYFINITGTTDYIWSDAGSVTATGFTSPTIYVNGVQTNTISSNQWNHVVVTTASAENASNLDIGRTQDSNYLEGTIDQVRLYSNTLTQSQVAWLYNRGAPVAHWKLDECLGTTANDSSGNSKNATITIGSNGTNTSAGFCNSGVGTEAWNNGTSGKGSSSIDLDGTDDYAQTSNTSLISADSNTYNQVSWGGWFNPDTSPTSDTLIIKGNGSTNNEFRITTDSSGVPQCQIYSGGWQSASIASSALPTNLWTHILCVYNGSTLKIYVNAKETGSSSISLNITSSNSTSLSIGRDPTGSGYFDGKIDEVKVWNYALTSQQIKNEYNSGTVNFGP